MPSVELGPYTVGEVPHDLVITFTDADDTALNLAGYTAAWVTFNPAGTETTTTVTITDAGNGEVTVSFLDDSLAIDVGGVWEAELWVGNTATKLASKHFWFYARTPIEAPVL